MAASKDSPEVKEGLGESVSESNKRKRKADSGQGAKVSKARRWSEKEVELLIDEFEKRSCVWDVFEQDYHNREKRERAYLELEEVLGINTSDIKSKVLGLRTQLGREMAKVSNTKSGQSSSENYKSNWIYWEKLQFLRPVIQAGKSKDTLSEGLHNRQTPSPDPSESELSINLDASFSGASSASSDSTPRKSTTRPSKRSTDGKREELLSTCIQVLKEPRKPPVETQQQCHFSMYVSEKLSTFDRRTRMIAEKRISDILFELEMNSQTYMQPQSQSQHIAAQYTNVMNDPNLYGVFPH